MKKIVLLASVLTLLSTALSLCTVSLLELNIVFASPYVDIDVNTAYNMITNGSFPDLVVLDVRTQGEYDSGHIYGAILIPHTELEARIGELAGHENHEIIVYCLAGGRSATASGILDSHNFTKVYNMLGGITAWQTAGYPVWIATVHNINTTFNYDTIQAAIDAPQTVDGHTILVDAGTYYERVVVNKSLSLIGDKGGTIVDGNFSEAHRLGSCIYITASKVNFTGFTIQNSGTGFMVGIYIIGSFSNNISYNLIKDTYVGIESTASSSNYICGNNITNNLYGIDLTNSYKNALTRNNVTESVWGISLWMSRGNNTLRYNTMLNNSYNFHVYRGAPEDIDVSNTVDGKPIYYWVNAQDQTIPSDAGYVALINSTNISVKDLDLKNNGEGVYLSHTNNSIITNNTVRNNREGICLWGSSNNIIFGNKVTENELYGIYGEYATNNCIYANNLTKTTNGIGLGYTSGCNISTNRITKNNVGIDLRTSNNNCIYGNNVTANWRVGINLDNSLNNIVSGNNISNNGLTLTPHDVGGIVLQNSSNNMFCYNDIALNGWGSFPFMTGGGIVLSNSSNNKFYHNDFMNNTRQVRVKTAGYSNPWDNGVEGNYWSNYTGVDSDHDGIGDSPHVIDASNQDNYPLMGMFSEFNATSEYNVQTICNSSISDFQYNGTAICFNVTGESGTPGFCRICIPTDLMNDTYKVFVNGTEVTHDILPCSNITHSYLYFTYDHSTQEVMIVPEFPTWTSMLLLLIVLTVVTAISKRRPFKKPIH